ncbi:MAG: CBS domain-containing protein [Spirochaetales bacterium]|nr:CBS domain-containing protein [Spirochaetales bacterium]
MNRKETVNELQLLVYELDVESAMTKEVVTVSPDLAMDKLPKILKSNRITGVPVTEDGRLVGIISLEDYVRWAADDGKPSCVGDVMTRKVHTIYSDEPLVSAVSRLERFACGRLPVLDRTTDTLAGIVTKGDVIESMLGNLEIDYREEGLRTYRTSRFFEDIVSDSTELSFAYEIRGESISEGGEVASSLKKTLRRLGMHPDVVRRAAITVYEAEMNVIIYAKAGRVRVSIDQHHISMVVEDEGPGIPDLEQAMAPGFSTAPESVRELGFGAGMGLPNIKQCAESFEIESVVGEGTTLRVSFHMEEACA